MTTNYYYINDETNENNTHIVYRKRTKYKTLNKITLSKININSPNIVLLDAFCQIIIFDAHKIMHVKSGTYCHNTNNLSIYGTYPGLTGEIKVNMLPSGINIILNPYSYTYIYKINMTDYEKLPSIKEVIKNLGLSYIKL